MNQSRIEEINEKQMPDGYEWTLRESSTHMGRVFGPDGFYLRNKNGNIKKYRHWDNAVADAWKDHRKRGKR
jgi:hypothetical protein